MAQEQKYFGLGFVLLQPFLSPNQSKFSFFSLWYFFVLVLQEFFKLQNAMHGWLLRRLIWNVIICLNEACFCNFETLTMVGVWVPGLLFHCMPKPYLGHFEKNFLGGIPRGCIPNNNDLFKFLIWRHLWGTVWYSNSSKHFYLCRAYVSFWDLKEWA